MIFDQNDLDFYGASLEGALAAIQKASKGELIDFDKDQKSAVEDLIKMALKKAPYNK